MTGWLCTDSDAPEGPPQNVENRRRRPTERKNLRISRGIVSNNVKEQAKAEIKVLDVPSSANLARGQNKTSRALMGPIFILKIGAKHRKLISINFRARTNRTLSGAKCAIGIPRNMACSVLQWFLLKHLT